MEDTVALAALIGIDWADQHHDVAVQEAGADQAEHERLPHTPEAIGSWMAALRHRFGNRPVGIAVETSRGPLIHALLEYDCVVLYPVNPRSLKRFRETFAPSGAKDDRPDAALLCELLVRHRDRLRAWRPDDVETRALRRLVESRRRTIRMESATTMTTVAAAHMPSSVGKTRAKDVTWSTIERL